MEADPSVTLTWTALDAANNIMGYEYRVLNPDGTVARDWTAIPGGAEVTEFTVAGLPDNAAGEMYTFAVRSVNEAGQSDTVAEIMAAVIPTFTEWMVLLLSLAMMAYLFRRRMSGIVSGAFKKVAS